MDSITRVAGSPHVFGLQGDSRSYVQVWKTSTSLIDGGANICLIGDLDLLVDIAAIPPLPISVAVNGDAPSLDNLCTRWGYLPLRLSDGWPYALANVILLQKRGGDHHLSTGTSCF